MSDTFINDISLTVNTESPAFVLTYREDDDRVLIKDGDEIVGKVDLRGPRGRDGLAGRTQTYVISEASTVWTIAHNKDSYPTVTVTDSDGQTVFAVVEYVSSNLITVNWDFPATGTVYIN